MKLIFAPDRIDIVISIDAETRSLIDRALKLVERDKDIAAMTASLKQSNEAMGAAQAAHPDPDTTD